MNWPVVWAFMIVAVEVVNILAAIYFTGQGKPLPWLILVLLCSHTSGFMAGCVAAACQVQLWETRDDGQ